MKSNRSVVERLSHSTERYLQVGLKVNKAKPNKRVVNDGLMLARFPVPWPSLKTGMSMEQSSRQILIVANHLLALIKPLTTMQILRLLILTSLPYSLLAAKSDPAKRFETFRKKALSSTPIKIDDTSYNELTASPRDYSAVVLLTALEARFGCHVCREFQPEWDVLAKSWTKGDRQGKSRLIYATLDFVDGKNTFQKVSEHPLGWL